MASTAFCSIGNKSDAFLEKLEPPLHLPQHSRCRKNIAVILYTICVSIFIEAPPPPQKKNVYLFSLCMTLFYRNANNHRGGQSQKKKTADGVSDIHRPNLGVKLLRTILHTSQTKHTQKKLSHLFDGLQNVFLCVSLFNNAYTAKHTTIAFFFFIHRTPKSLLYYPVSYCGGGMHSTFRLCQMRLALLLIIQ